MHGERHEEQNRADADGQRERHSGTLTRAEGTDRVARYRESAPGAAVLSFLFGLALAMDPAHTKLQDALTGRVSGGRVDYAGLRAAPQKLDAYLAEIATVSLSALPAAEKKAFLINAYNAVTLDLVADNYPLPSIRDLDGGKVWSTRRFRVAGADRTLDELEHTLLRPMGDPRIHAAVNCAAVGCPPLASTVFTAARLDAQLDAVSRAWAATATLAGGVLTVNAIFDWFGDDFVAGYGTARFDIPALDGKQEAAANFIAAYAPDKADALRRGGYRVEYAAYDWALNRK